MTISAGAGERVEPGSLARRIANAAARDVPPLALIAAFVAEPSTRDFALVNLCVQVALFVAGACIPAYRTRVMAFADCVWPWGLAAIGVQALLFGETGSAPLVIVAAIYLVMGVRGGAMGLKVALTDFPHDDLPRYRYRRLLWRREGYRSEAIPMQHEILQQCFANASLLAAPALLVAADQEASLGPLVIAGALLWAVSWALESLADLEKARFVRRQKAEGASRTCDAGLWRWSRHPNYFFQWLQWHGLVLIALPSLVHAADGMAVLPWIAFAVALLAIPGGMYYVLVHYTGAIPAEHFSVQHRPDYRAYQQQVNRFFPGPRRRRDAPSPG